MKKDEIREYVNRDAESLRALNFAETYIKSVVENTSKWGNTGLLSGLNDPYVGRTVASLLENQRVLNENWPGKGYALIPEGAATDIPLDQWVPQWRRVSIPVIRRVFGEGFAGYQLVSVQAMRSGQENTYLTNFEGRTIGGMTEARTVGLRSRWSPPMTGEFNLDAEAHATADFSEAVCTELGREIIRDLASNAGSNATYEYKDEAHLLSLVEGMSAYIAAKTYGHDATWVVTSPAIVKLLGEHIETELDLDDERRGISLIGTLAKNWRLFEDSSAPSGNILLGHKDHRNHYFSGYVFAPFLPVNPTPAWATESQHGHGQVLSRYGKRLTNPGFYGTIKIENLPQATPLEEAGTEDGESEA